MNGEKSSWVFLLIFTALQLAIAGKDDPEIRSNAPINKILNNHAFQNIIKEAGEFFGNLTAAKNASAAVGLKLDELRSALSQPKSNKTTSTAILLPSGWDKKTIIEALTKALSQQNQFQELSDKFDRFMAEIRKLENSISGTRDKENNATTQIKEKPTNVTIHPSNIPLGNPSTLDNSTLMGKLIGFIKTGRHLGSVQISDLNPCLNKGGSCDQWRKGLENLREFFSKSKSKLSDLFKNSATLRKISEEIAPTLIKDHNKNSTRKSNVTKHRNATVASLNVTTTKEPIDYFDYYYNGEEKDKQSSPLVNRTIFVDKVDAPSRKNVSIAASNNVLTGARKMVDYFDYYYHQGIPPFTSNKTRFVGGKLGG